jgi:hypothetical protein
MITKVQKQFQADYILLRGMLLRGDITKKKIQLWFLSVNENIDSKIKHEIKHSKKFKQACSRLSPYEKAMLKEIHEPDGYNNEDGEEQ